MTDETADQSTATREVSPLSGFSRPAATRFLATEEWFRRRLEKFSRAEARRDERAEVVLVKHVRTAADLLHLPRRLGSDLWQITGTVFAGLATGVAANMIFAHAFTWANFGAAGLLFGLATTCYSYYYGPR